MKRSKEETTAQRLFRDFLMANYDTEGPQHRIILLSTRELIYRFRGTAEISIPEALEILEYLGYHSRQDASGAVQWVLYELHDPIDSWV